MADQKKMIVKVQIPLMSSEEEMLALVYDKTRKFDVFMRITKDLEKAMNGRPKAFFHAYYDKEANNTVLIEEAPWQTW